MWTELTLQQIALSHPIPMWPYLSNTTVTYFLLGINALWWLSTTGNFIRNESYISESFQKRRRRKEGPQSTEEIGFRKRNRSRKWRDENRKCASRKSQRTRPQGQGNEKGWNKSKVLSSATFESGKLVGFIYFCWFDILFELFLYFSYCLFVSQIFKYFKRVIFSFKVPQETSNFTIESFPSLNILQNCCQVGGVKFRRLTRNAASFPYHNKPLEA